jgi:GNAT superfamily N-acetyltransferase
VASPLAVAEVPRHERDAVVPLLLLAEPSVSALEWSLEHLSDTVYRFDAEGKLVGAATMRWGDEPAELVELAVVSERQGVGIGREIVAWLIAEARRRGTRAVEVGTASASLGNIAFYQKCGFRPSTVRRDYFWYHREPLVENGIPVRDMIVFRYDLEPGPSPHSRRPPRRGR